MSTGAARVRVAVGVDESGRCLNREHFGDSHSFLIYDVSRDRRIEFIEARPNLARELEEAEHGDPRKFREVERILSDVDVFLAARMGPNYLRIRRSSRYPLVVGFVSVEEALQILLDRLGEVLSGLETLRGSDQT